IFKFWWETKKVSNEESFTGKNAAEVLLAGRDGSVVDLVPETVAEGAPQTYAFTLETTRDLSFARYQAIPPEDFAVAPDTAALAGAACGGPRTGRRTRDLRAEGSEAGGVRAVAPAPADTALDAARDGSHGGDAGSGDLRQVEVREHYIRLADREGELTL